MSIPPILSQNSSWQRIKQILKAFTWQSHSLRDFYKSWDYHYHDCYPCSIDLTYLENTKLQSIFMKLCYPIIYRKEMTSYQDLKDDQEHQKVQMPYCPIIDYISWTTQNKDFYASQLQKLLDRFPYENNALLHSYNISKCTQDAFSFIPVPKDTDIINYVLKFMPEDDLLQLACIPEDQLWLKTKFTIASMMRHCNYFENHLLKSSAKPCYLFELFEKEQQRLEQVILFRKPQLVLENRETWTKTKYAVEAAFNPIHGPPELPIQIKQRSKPQITNTHITPGSLSYPPSESSDNSENLSTPPETDSTVEIESIETKQNHRVRKRSKRSGTEKSIKPETDSAVEIESIESKQNHRVRKRSEMSGTTEESIKPETDSAVEIESIESKQNHRVRKRSEISGTEKSIKPETKDETIEIAQEELISEESTGYEPDRQDLSSKRQTECAIHHPSWHPDSTIRPRIKYLRSTSEWTKRDIRRRGLQNRWRQNRLLTNAWMPKYI